MIKMEWVSVLLLNAYSSSEILNRNIEISIKLIRLCSLAVLSEITTSETITKCSNNKLVSEH